MDHQKEIVSVLHHLIERCKDGSKGFFTASEDVDDPQLKEIFRNFAVQRDGMITQLQDELHKLGTSDTESGSIEGKVHRAWIDLSSTLASKDKTRILEECERGEDYAVSAYKKALETNLPANVHQIVEQQFQQVKQAHDQVRTLRDQAKSA